MSRHDTLEDRIAEGPLALKDGLDIARQTADGLQAAHTKGVFHRDIKPANIVISPEGRATIMDFGLARLTEPSRLTKTNTATGTVAYMSPEHAQGIEVDSRTDIWALGCVLYEMISGQRPFQGQYDQALLYEIVHEEPAALTGLRTGVPVELEFIVAECLAKDRDDRTGTAQEVSRKLRTLAEKLKSGRSTVLSPPDPAAAATRHSSPAPSMSQRLPWAIAGLSLVAAIVVGLGSLREPATEGPGVPLRRFSYTPEEAVHGAQISRDGRNIAYTAGEDRQLWIQGLDQQQPRKIEGVTRAECLFWSPDSEHIGFTSGSELRRVGVNGGASRVLCRMPNMPCGGSTWSPDGESIVFGAGAISQLYEVSALGGAPKPAIEVDEAEQSISYLRPSFLPIPGRGVLTVFVGSVFEGNLIAHDLDTDEIVDLGSFPWATPYSPTGHLLAGDPAGRLRAFPFGLERLAPQGEGFVIAEGVEGYSFDISVASDGTLVYVDASSVSEMRLVWRNRKGERVGSIGQAQLAIDYPSLSPDGSYVAVRGLEPGEDESDVWLHGVVGNKKSRITFYEGHDSRPIWRPTGKEIVYPSARERGDYDIFLTPIDMAGEEQLLTSQPLWEIPNDWSADGRFLIYHVLDPQTREDLWLLERSGEDYTPRPFLQTRFDEGEAQFSPNGQWIAYESDESGRDEVYITSFPDGEVKHQVSTRGGRDPRWRGDGKELFYVQDETLVAVPISTPS